MRHSQIFMAHEILDTLDLKRKLEANLESMEEGDSAIDFLNSVDPKFKERFRIKKEETKMGIDAANNSLRDKVSGLHVDLKSNPLEFRFVLEYDANYPAMPYRVHHFDSYGTPDNECMLCLLEMTDQIIKQTPEGLFEIIDTLIGSRTMGDIHISKINRCIYFSAYTNQNEEGRISQNGAHQVVHYFKKLDECEFVKINWQSEFIPRRAK